LCNNKRPAKDGLYASILKITVTLSFQHGGSTGLEDVATAFIDGVNSCKGKGVDDAKYTSDSGIFQSIG